MCANPGNSQKVGCLGDFVDANNNNKLTTKKKKTPTSVPLYICEPHFILYYVAASSHERFSPLPPFPHLCSTGGLNVVSLSHTSPTSPILTPPSPKVIEARNPRFYYTIVLETMPSSCAHFDIFFFFCVSSSAPAKAGWSVIFVFKISVFYLWQHYTIYPAVFFC